MKFNTPADDLLSAGVLTYNKQTNLKFGIIL